MHTCRVILVEPHYPGNIGATARVMRNFGLERLALVKPVANPLDREALQMSTHGEAILRSARVVADFGEAVGDCVLVVGTSARHGGLFRRQSVGSPEQIMPRVSAMLRRQQPVALVFGPEPTGLSDDIVTRCHHLVSIPAAEEYPALNLAQSVAVCLYELRKQWDVAGEQSAERSSEGDAPAPFEAQETLFENLRVALTELHFLYGDKADALMHAVRHLLGKAKLTTMEVKVLLGLARQIRWFVANHTKD